MQQCRVDRGSRYDPIQAVPTLLLRIYVKYLETGFVYVCLWVDDVELLKCRYVGTDFPTIGREFGNFLVMIPVDLMEDADTLCARNIDPL